MVDLINRVLLALSLWVWLWNFYIFIFNRGVPNIRTAPAIRKRIIALLKEDMALKNGASYRIVDLGSGNGLLTRQIARALPEACVTGFEISFLAFHWSELFRKASGLKNLTYVHGDFFKHGLGEADAVTVFQYGNLREISEKLKRELKDDALVTSNKFPLAGWLPVQIIDIKTLYPHQKELYVYRACASWFIISLVFYKLVNKRPVKCATGQEWADWYEAAAQSGERDVARDELEGGAVIIYTIFTGIDQDGGDPPQLFETMMFLNGKSTGVALRSETWQQAESQHRRVARQVEKADEDA